MHLPTDSPCQFQVLPLRLRLQSLTLNLEKHNGNLWHSGFGVALKQHFPQVFQQLFSDQTNASRLYALAPPARKIAPGETFELGINLFGPATRHAVACTQAIGALANSGMGDAQGRFLALEARVAGHAPFIEQAGGLQGWPTALNIHELLAPTASRQGRLRVEFTTPAAIKQDNTLYFGDIPFAQLVRRLHGRLAKLCDASGSAHPLNRDQIAAQLAAAAQIRLVHGDLQRQEVKRRSSRSGHTMHFAGMTGSQTYCGDLGPFVGLLSLSEYLQIGGKTAFGFGCIKNHFTWEK